MSLALSRVALGALLPLCWLSHGCSEEEPKPAASFDASAGADGGLDAAPLDAAWPDGANSVDADVDAASDGETLQPAGEVSTTSGSVQGKLRRKTRAYLGIPYAEAPVGALRFAPPRPAPAWQGTRMADSYGPVCPQRGYLSAAAAVLPQSEDCLSLNVFTPATATRQPVLVFIHGGSGVSGSGAEYDGQQLSEAGDVLVVTFNYRLAALASLTLAALDDVLDVPSGNLALRDHQAALRWVHDNIAAFGGDPQNVTLFGESAGAITSCLHLFARGSETLVHKVIMESGGCVGSAVSPGTRANAEAPSQDLAKALCPNANDLVACLRALPVKSLLEYENTRGNVLEQLGTIHVDGALLPEHPVRLLRDGKYNHVPVLLGSNRNEARFLQFPPFKQNWPLVNNVLELSIGLSVMYPDTFLQILGHYGLPADDAAANDIMLRLMDDSWFRCPARALARELTKQGGRAYLYSFDLTPAVHTMELDYVFGWPEAHWSRHFEGAPAPALPTLIEEMQGYWLRFARSSDPNGGGSLAWPRYERSADAHLVLDRTLSTASKLGEADCDFWDSLLITPRL